MTQIQLQYSGQLSKPFYNAIKGAVTRLSELLSNVFIEVYKRFPQETLLPYTFVKGRFRDICDVSTLQAVIKTSLNKIKNISTTQMIAENLNVVNIISQSNATSSAQLVSATAQCHSRKTDLSSIAISTKEEDLLQIVLESMEKGSPTLPARVSIRSIIPGNADTATEHVLDVDISDTIPVKITIYI